MQLGKARDFEFFQWFNNLGEHDDSVPAKLLFYVPFVIWLAFKMLYTYTFFGDTIKGFVSYSQIRMICFAMLAIREILYGKWTRTSMLGLAIMGTMAFIAHKANFNHLVDAAFFIFAARDMRFKNIARIALVVMLVSYSSVLIGCAMGLIPDTMYVDSDRTRHTLGFTWPNSPAAFPFYMLCLWVFLRGKKLGFVDLSIGVLITGALFYLTASRSALLASIVLIVLTILGRVLPKKVLRSRILKIASISSVALVAIAAIVVVFIYDPSNSTLVQLDKLSSGRISLAHNVIVNYGTPLFGQAKSFGGVDHKDINGNLVRGDYANLIDCVYPKLLVHCGVVFFALAIVLCTLAARKAYKEGQKYILIVMVPIAIHGCFEPFAAYLHFNVFLLLLGMLFQPVTVIDPEQRT